MPQNDASPARSLTMKRGHNLRDLGGYRTGDGRMTRWRTVFRAGTFTASEADDAALLRALGIVSICDLRTNTERARRPIQGHEQLGVEIWSRDHVMSIGAISKMARRTESTAGEMTRLMHAVYRELPFEQSESYSEIFRRILNGQLPMIFNCAAGKDRTGVAAALLLTAVGVSWSDVEADYLLTNEALQSLIPLLKADPEYASIVRDRPDVAMPLLRAEPDYLATAFAEIQQRHGSVQSYFADVLGLSGYDIERLRNRLLA